MGRHRKNKHRAIKLHFNLSYGNHDRQQLDVYCPQKKGNAPVVFFIHGGGWSQGSKDAHHHIGHYLSTRGFCVVIANHRLSPEIKHPNHARDVARAFSWTKKHILGYGGNPNHISLMGHSSGAHLAALLCCDPNYLLPHGHSSKEIHSFVGISGVYKIDLMITLAGYGHVFEDKDRHKASPIAYFPSCPCLLTYGEYDYATMPRQAKAFSDRIVRCGSQVETVIAEYQTHESIVQDIVRPDMAYSQTILEFLRK